MSGGGGEGKRGDYRVVVYGRGEEPRRRVGKAIRNGHLLDVKEQFGSKGVIDDSCGNLKEATREKGRRGKNKKGEERGTCSTLRTKSSLLSSVSPVGWCGLAWGERGKRIESDPSNWPSTNALISKLSSSMSTNTSISGIRKVTSWLNILAL